MGVEFGRAMDERITTTYVNNVIMAWTDMVDTNTDCVSVFDQWQLAINGMAHVSCECEVSDARVDQRVRVWRWVRVLLCCKCF